MIGESAEIYSVPWLYHVRDSRTKPTQQPGLFGLGFEKPFAMSDTLMHLLGINKALMEMEVYIKIITAIIEAFVPYMKSLKFV